MVIDKNGKIYNIPWVNFAVVYLPKADTSNTSYDTCVGIVNLNGFVQYVFIINIMAAVNGTDSHVHA